LGLRPPITPMLARAIATLPGADACAGGAARRLSRCARGHQAMTAAIPASQEAVVGTGPSRAAETGGVRGAMLLVAVRVALWVGARR
jgi:hypothetical protein